MVLASLVAPLPSIDVGSGRASPTRASPAIAPPRRVHLQSDPIFLGTGKPSLTQLEIEQRAAMPLADFKPEAAKGGIQLGSTSRPEVQDFFDRALAGRPVEPARLAPMAARGTLTQRLRAAKPLAKRADWGAPDFTAFNHAHGDAVGAMCAAGLPLRREAVRATPSTRLAHIVRPGFLERGQQSVSLTMALRRRDEEARLEAQHARSEAQRRVLRRRAEANQRQRAAFDLVPKQNVETATRRATDEFTSAYERANSEGRAMVSADLDRFDRLRGTLGTAAEDVEGAAPVPLVAAEQVQPRRQRGGGGEGAVLVRGDDVPRSDEVGRRQRPDLA